MSLDYFTLVELRAQPGLDDFTAYPDAKLTSAGEWVQAVIEREVGTSFVARSTVEVLNGDDQDSDGGLKLGTPYVLDVTGIVSNGVSLTAPQLAEVTFKNGVLIRQSSYTGFIAWDAGVRNVEVTFDAGYSTVPPKDIFSAALQGARDRVFRTSGTGLSDRTQSVTDDQGTRVLAAPGTNRPTGLPEVDAVIIGWRDKLALFGFA